MTAALATPPTTAVSPQPMPPSAMTSSSLAAGSGSLVDATYGEGAAPGAVIPISRNDPDNVAGGRSVTQEVLGTSHRGAALMAALYASGLPPLAIARDLRQAGAQGLELIERLLDARAPFDRKVLDPMRDIAAFELLRSLVGRSDASSRGGASETSPSARERRREDAERIMDKLIDQFPLSANEQKVQEYDHAYRVVGHHQGGKTSGDRGADLFVVDASFTGELVIDGGNVRRVENRVHFDGPPRWIGPFKPIDTSHRYSFVMKKLDETGRVIAQIRSVHNHELEGSGLVGTQHITLFEVPQTGLDLGEALGVLSMVVGLIPGGQLPAAVLSFARAGLKVLDGGKIGIGDLIGLVVSGIGVAGAAASASGNLALVADLDLARKIVVGAGGVVQGIESGDWKKAVSAVVALGVSTNAISQEAGQFLHGGLAAYQAAAGGDYGTALTTLFGAAVQSKLLPREASLIVSGGVMAVHAFLKGDYATAAMAVLGTVRDTGALSSEVALVLGAGVAAVGAFLKGDYAAAAGFVVGGAVAGQVLSPEVGLLLLGGVAGVAALLRGDAEAAVAAILAVGVAGKVLSPEVALVIRAGGSAIKAFLAGDTLGAANAVLSAAAGASWFPESDLRLIRRGLDAVVAVLKGNYQPLLELGGELLTPPVAPVAPALPKPVDPALDAIRKEPKPDAVPLGPPDPLETIRKEPKPDTVPVDPLETIRKEPKPDAVPVDPLETIFKGPKVPVDPLETIFKGPKVPVVDDGSGGVFLEVGWGGSAVQIGKDFYNASILAADYFPTEIGKYIPDIEDVRQGLVLLMGGATVIVGGSAGIGAVIGGLTTGGAGIAAGAAIGARVGAEILKYLGFGFLVIQLGQATVELGTFFNLVVQAKGDAGKIDAAARQLAKALALVLMLAVEALVGYAAQKSVPVVLEKLRGSKLLEVLDLQVARAWLLRKVKAYNLLRLAKGDKAGLRKAITFYKSADEVERLLRSGRTLAQINGLADSSTAFQQIMGKNYAPLMKDAADLLSDPTLKAALSALTQEEIAAIIGYTGMDYALLNSALRSNTPRRVAKLAPYIDRITGGLRQLPDYVGVVYRGASPPADVVARYVVGNVVEEAAFTSTSLTKGSAFMGKVQYSIVSKTGKKINFLSMFGGEEEVLFAPGARFKVLEVTPSGNTTHVKMSQL